MIALGGLWSDIFEYNTLVVLAGTVVLAVSAGVVGVFMLVRKRALVGDVVGHAALPGVAIAFLYIEMFRSGGGKNMAGLLVGAWLAAMTGILCVLAIRRFSRIKEDAAMAIVLSIFFGAGVVLLSVIQKVDLSQSGLKDYIFGMAAAMVMSDVYLNAAVALLVLCLCAVFFKELTLLCFDEEFAATQGWPVATLDLLLMSLIVCVAVAGMQSVGVLLVVALLIIPAAAARFWTDRMFPMTLISSGLGGVSAGLAIIVSRIYGHLATGPLIVLASAMFFLISMFFGRRRGVLRRLLVHWRLTRRVGRHDLLRAAYEYLERALTGTGATSEKEMTAHAIPIEALLEMRSWSAKRLKRLIASARREKLLDCACVGEIQLTSRGFTEAVQAIRNHRLWEMYLITYADIAPSHVDRDADQIEHVLDAELVRELESGLAQYSPQMHVPASPHKLS